MENPLADEKLRTKTLVEDVKPIVMALIFFEVIEISSIYSSFRKKTFKKLFDLK